MAGLKDDVSRDEVFAHQLSFRGLRGAAVSADGKIGARFWQPPESA